MDYRLLASDLDGTLFNKEHKISNATVKAIRKWVKSGRYFIPATGRPFCGTNTVRELFKDDEDMPFIVSNGSIAIMHKSKEILFSIYIPPNLVSEIYNLGQHHDIPVLLWSRDNLYSNRDCEYVRFYSGIIGADAKVLSGPKEAGNIAVNEKVNNILWLDKPERIAVHQKEMKAGYADKLNCVASAPGLFEFVALEASKAKALEKIGPRLGVSREEMAAVGDGYNDLSMLEYAGFSIAMGNASEDIKSACDHVTLSNNEDGVAVWMENYLK